MITPVRAGAALTAVLLGLSACTGGETGADPDPDASGSSSASAPSEELREAVEARDDAYPTLEGGQDLPDDVTVEQLQRWADDGRLPPAQAQSTHFETMINAIGARRRAPDVMLFGDSMAQQGIDPEVLGDELGDETGGDVTAFNAASSKARWGINRMIARHLVETDRVPDVAVLVTSTRGAGDDPHYEDIARTPFSSVVEGCVREDEGWTDKDARRCRTHVQDPTARFATAGEQVERAREGKAAQTSLRVDEDTWLRSDGFMIHPSRSRDAVERRTETRLDGRTPGLPEATEDGKEQFRDLVRILEEQGTTVISTEIPYSPPYQRELEKKYPGYDTRRQESARALVEGAGVPHFPVDAYGDWWGDGDSRDEIHLASQGAGKYTHQLLEDVPGLRSAITEGLEEE